MGPKIAIEQDLNSEVVDDTRMEYSKEFASKEFEIIVPQLSVYVQSLHRHNRQYNLTFVM